MSDCLFKAWGERLRATIPLVYVLFDVLELDGRSTMTLPFRERRQLLESLELHGPQWQTSAVFDDGEALAVARERGLEGVVAKRLGGVYTPGERGWIKVKNRAYWRWEIEREGAIRAETCVVRLLRTGNIGLFATRGRFVGIEASSPS